MAYTGVQSWQIYKDYFIFTATGFKADAEYTTTHELYKRIPFLPSHYTMNVELSAGATNLIDVDLELSTFDGNFKEVHLTLTDSQTNNAASCASTTIDYTSAVGKPTVGNYPRMRIITNTVGAGNTFTVTLVGKR